MKRTIKHPDGREETQEGTPEEFRRLDEVAYRAAADDWWAKSGLLFPDYSAPVGTGQPCMFEGLPPGAYHLSCPCPRHST